MKQQSNYNNPADMLLKKIKGGSQTDYTIFSSNRPSPLHILAKEYRKRYPKRPIHSEILISEITDPTSQKQHIISETMDRNQGGNKDHTRPCFTQAVKGQYHH